jgi:hypothetical protein
MYQIRRLLAGMAHEFHTEIQPLVRGPGPMPVQQMSQAAVPTPNIQHPAGCWHEGQQSEQAGLRQ